MWGPGWAMPSVRIEHCWDTGHHNLRCNFCLCCDTDLDTLAHSIFLLPSCPVCVQARVPPMAPSRPVPDLPHSAARGGGPAQADDRV